MDCSVSNADTTHSINLVGWHKNKCRKNFFQCRLPLPNSAISSFFLMIFGRRGRQVIVVILHCSTFWKCVLSLVLASCSSFKGETHLLANIWEYKIEKLQIRRGNSAFFQEDCIVLACTKMFYYYYIQRGYIDLNYFCVLDRDSWKWI